MSAQAGKTVFISYSHRDRRWLDRLVTQLKALALQEGSFDIWTDTRIATGEDWREEIQTVMGQARIAILLVSANLLASQFIKEQEVKVLLHRRAAEGLRVLPILVGPCNWDRVDWLQGIQVKTANGKSLADLDGAAKADRILAEVAGEVADSVQLDQARRGRSRPAPTPAGKAVRLATGLEPARRETIARLEQRAAERGEADVLLYTFCGLSPVPRGQEPPRPAIGLTSLFRLWADPTHEDNRIQASVASEAERKYFKLRFHTEPGSYPCDVTLRPCGFSPLLNPDRQRFLSLDARAFRVSGTPRGAGFKLGLSFRVIDGQATQWTKGQDRADTVEVPLDGRWHSIHLDLLDERWTLFTADGNFYYAKPSLDPGIIAALVIELGGLGGSRLGSGAARVDIADLRLSRLAKV